LFIIYEDVLTMLQVVFKSTPDHKLT